MSDQRQGLWARITNHLHIKDGVDMNDLALQLFATYHASFGIPSTWDTASDQEKAAWNAVADKVVELHTAEPLPTAEPVVSAAPPSMFKYGLGSTLQDKYHVHGTVKSWTMDDHGRAGYWLLCLDAAGRPFDHYVEEDDVVAPAAS